MFFPNYPITCSLTASKSFLKRHPLFSEAFPPLPFNCNSFPALPFLQYLSLWHLSLLNTLCVYFVYFLSSLPKCSSIRMWLAKAPGLRGTVVKCTLGFQTWGCCTLSTGDTSCRKIPLALLGREHQGPLLHWPSRLGSHCISGNLGWGKLRGSFPIFQKYCKHERARVREREESEGGGREGEGERERSEKKGREKVGGRVRRERGRETRRVEREIDLIKIKIEFTTTR